MSRFLANVARRGAGLTPTIVPRPASIPPLFGSPIPRAAASESNLTSGVASAARPRPIADTSPTAREPTVPPPQSRLSHSAEGATGPVSLRFDCPSPRPDEPSAPPPSRGPVDAERTPVRPPPTAARSDEPPETNRIAPREASPRERIQPDTPSGRVHTVAVEPRADPDATAPLPQRILEVPAAKSASSAPPATRTTTPTGASEPPRVHVRIGKVEVRASAPAATLVRPPRPKGSRGFSEVRLARAHLDRDYR
jgi:hypothetical protein